MKSAKTTNNRKQDQGLNQTKEEDQTLTHVQVKTNQTPKDTKDNIKKFKNLNQGKKDESQVKTNQTSNDNKDNIKKVQNNIIPEYDEKKKLSDEMSSLCTEVLVLTQMVNNMNIEKGNLIKQYKTVITKIQTIFQTINDENIFRTKQHIF